MYIFYSEKHKLHDPAGTNIGGQPFVTEDVSARVEFILEALRQANVGEIRSPMDYGLEPILAVHDPDYVDFLQNIYRQYSAYYGQSLPVVPETFAPRLTRRRPQNIPGRAGYYAFGVGSPILEHTWTASYWSAQCALSAVDCVKRGQSTCYALCRPPGHHAGSSLYGGFCYINNAAVAARYSWGRVAILDVDYHHGNGTQELFYRDPSVLYCSLHAHPDIDYPYYWGEAGEIGAGPGTGYNWNFPLPAGTEDMLYLSTLDKALKIIDQFYPDLLIVSLGLDIGLGDPAGGFRISTRGFREIGEKIHSINLPTALIQEGGYQLETLGKSAVAFLSPFILLS